MGQGCKVCNLDEKTRKKMEEDYVNGVSVTKIAQKSGIGYDSVYRHMREDVPESLIKAMDEKKLDYGSNLLNKIDDVLDKATTIFKRNYEKERDGMALKALQEKRNTLELLSKISWALHQSKVQEREARQAESFGQDDEKIAEMQARLNKTEKDVYFRLLMKMTGQADEDVFQSDDEDEPEPDWDDMKIKTQNKAPERRLGRRRNKNTSEDKDAQESKENTDDDPLDWDVQLPEEEDIPELKKRPHNRHGYIIGRNGIGKF